VRPIGDVIVEINAELDTAGVRHAFGGALALAYYAEPRGTVDVDINVGVPVESRSTLLSRLDSIGWHSDADTAQTLPAAGTRLHQPDETVVIDLFFAFDELHEVVLDRAVQKPFMHAGVRHELPFLSAEDLTIFKMSFGRTKDWVDIEAMIAAGTLIDADYVERQLVRFKGPTAYPSAARLRAMLRGQSW
jgi:hypothetical protein